MILIADRPGPGAARPYRFPQVIRREGVVAAHLPGQPLAVAVLLLDAGAGREPSGREGVATVLAKALQEGTAAHDATAYALALEGLGSRLFTTVDWDSFRIGVQAPANRLHDAVALLAEAVRTPRLNPPDVARVRDDRVTALRMRWAEPGPRADAALRADLFGVSQRHGQPLQGDPDSVAAVDVADVAGFHGDWFGQRGTLLVAGDLDQLDLEVLGAAVFAGAGAQVSATGDPLPVVTPPDRRIILVDRPGSVQSALRLGHAAPHRAHPDYVPMTLAATVLGGAFTSRLNHLIREVRGYTYGIRSTFDQSRRFGRLVVSTAVQTGVTAPALADTIGEIARTNTGGVTEDELLVARAWRAGQLSVELQTPGAITSALATLVVHGLPDDYHATLRTALLEATADEVSAAAGQHLRPGGLSLVVEGDAAVLRDELAAIGEVV
jgi:predicted Zn-dependent peptidase